MKKLVEVIAKALVDHPEEVTVTETEKDNATVVELRVSPTDMGKVIGKQGRIAKAIRSVVKAAASRDDKKVIVEKDDTQKGAARSTRMENRKECHPELRAVVVNRRMENMEQFLRVGVISSTHGIRGEVKVYPTTDDPERFLDLKTIYLDT